MSTKSPLCIPPGVFDILPKDPKDEWKNVHLWEFVEKIMREHVRLYACQEIRTPIFESTALFCRSVGDETDIVSKEMYTFEDRGGRSLSLRPEGTAAVMRAFIEKQLQMQAPIHRLFYIGPMFRYERPQSGRFRQHHQLGVEFIGNKEPELDAELIEMLYSLYARLGITDLVVHLNSLGDAEARKQFREALVAYLQPHAESLSHDSKRRLQTNPLRVLDSKAECDKKIIEKAPSILDFLSDEAKEHFTTTQRTLDILKVPFTVNHRLVRGLDYYTRTVFEITTGALGAQNTIGAGGRYDGLMKLLGGPDLPTLGYATGIERILQTMLNQGLLRDLIPKIPLVVIPLGEQGLMEALTLVQQLRKEGIEVYLDTTKKKLKQSMSHADTMRAEFVLVLGDNELAAQKVDLKNMCSGEKVTLPLTAIAQFLKLRAYNE